MKKISITKKDSVPRVVEKIIESGESEIVLAVAPNSVLRGSVSDFELIKREAEAAGKSISVSSSDKKVIETAEKAGINILSGTGKSRKLRLISDIIPLESNKEEKREAEPSVTLSVETEKEETSTQTESFWARAEEEAGSKKIFAEEIGEPPLSEKETEKPQKYSLARKIAISAAMLVLIAGTTGWAAGFFFGKTEISLSFKKIPWQYSGTVVALKTLSQIDVSKNHLPAEIFTQQKNTTRLFPASGTSQVSEKATANILIYNAYSSSKQTLVASTRFAAPDGKIFRLNNPVVIPGADIKDGKIIPSSIETAVTADKAGADYNVGPFDKLTIPGFKGTPRYDGFYGVMPQAASGGFVGQKKTPTEQDIASAKEKTSQGLKDALQASFLGAVPGGFKILDGASETNVTKLNVNKATDDKGNFSVLGEASFRAAGFKEEDLKSLISSLMNKDNPDMVFKELKISYQGIKADFAAGQVTFSVSADGVIMPRFSEGDLKSKITGKPVNEAESAVAALPGLTSGEISVWPFWLGKLPSAEDRIKIIWN